MNSKLYLLKENLICDMKKEELDFIKLLFWQPDENNCYLITEDDVNDLKKGLNDKNTKRIASILINLCKKHKEVKVRIEEPEIIFSSS